MIEIDKEREAFEAFAKSEYDHNANFETENYDIIVYKDDDVQIMWLAWQARAKQHSGETVGFVSASEIKDMKAGLDSSAYLQAHADDKYTIPVFLNAQECKGWISVEDRLPPKGVMVQVYMPINKHFNYGYDCWDEIHEAPVMFSTQTICVGEGWQENEFEEISHWQPLPSAPTKG